MWFHVDEDRAIKWIREQSRVKKERADRVAAVCETIVALGSHERAEVFEYVLKLIDDELEADERRFKSSRRQAKAKGKRNASNRSRRESRAIGGADVRAFRKFTLREAVLEVLANSEGLQTGAIFEEMRKFKSDANYSSLVAEIARMKKAKLLVESGQTSRGALYAIGQSVGGHKPKAVT
jgi:DnaJ-domain-containing protein 1